MTMTQAIEAYLAAPDHELWTAVTTAEGHALCSSIDAFFSTCCAVQTKRIESSDVENQSLKTQSRLVFLLYMRLLTLLQTKAKRHLLTEEREVMQNLCNLARIVPFCQLYATQNPQPVATLLEQLMTKLPAFEQQISNLQSVYVKFLERIHHEIKRNQRALAKDLLLRVYEVTLSLHGLLCSKPVRNLILLNKTPIDQVLDTKGSLLHALVVCYESDLPQLQRTAARTEELTHLIAAIRHHLLQILGMFVELLMETSSDSEVVLSQLHALGHCVVDDNAEQGSALSDLWSILHYQDQCTAYLIDNGLDADQIAYLNQVIQSLPQRQPVASVTNKSTQEAPVEVNLSVGKTPVKDDDVVMQSMVHQVMDLFPDVGDGFVELCLRQSDHQLEVVINLLLENNLPPALASIDRKLKKSDTNAFKTALQQLQTPPSDSKKLNPETIWIGKKAMEQSYDPQVRNKDPALADKLKLLATSYDYVEEYTVQDEYNDDYNDEFEDYEPFSVMGGAQADDFEAIREENRRLRAQEEEDAFWESMKNPNHQVDDPDEHEEEKEEAEATKPIAASQPSRQPKPRSTPTEPPTQTPMTQQHRQRARNQKNKGKVANHHRKDRALKKQGGVM